MTVSLTRTPSVVYGETNPNPAHIETLFDEVIDGIEATTTANVFGDTFNELVLSDATDPVVGGTTAPQFGSLVRGSANSPFDDRVSIVRTGAGNLRRYISLAKMGVRTGDTIRIRVLAYFAGLSGPAISANIRDSGGSNIDTNSAASVSSGVNDYTTDAITITADAVDIFININDGSNDRELLAVAVGIGDGVPSLTAGAVSGDLAREFSLGENLAPDPFFRQYDAGITSAGGYSLGTQTWSIVDYASSPFSRQRAQFFAGGQSFSNRNFDFDRLGARVGDRITFTVGVIAPVGGEFRIGCFFREADGTVINTPLSIPYDLEDGVYQEVRQTLEVTQAMLDDASYVEVRTNSGATNFTSGYYICGWGIHTGVIIHSLRDDSAADDERDIAIANAAAADRTDTAQLSTLREFRLKTRQRLLGESARLRVAMIGDSWTHFAARWSGPTAENWIAAYGDGGGGWLGFGSGASETLDNGNVRPSDYTYARSGAGWASTYATSTSPDICHITSSTAADKITVEGPASPTLSDVYLFHIGTADGVVRYRWNAGSWTSVNVQGTVDLLQRQALSGVPGSGTWTLEIEVVSGTCSLAGLDIQSAADGVVVHKLGATGSLAQQWVAVDETAFQNSLALLEPDCVIIMHGTNDQASRSASQFSADIGTLIDRVKASRPSTDVFVIMPSENQNGSANTMASYAAAVYDVCKTKNVAFLNLQNYFGDDPADYADGSDRPLFNADGVHPDPATGGVVIVDAVVKATTN